jgi:hypothetical protein
LQEGAGVEEGAQSASNGTWWPFGGRRRRKDKDEEDEDEGRTHETKKMKEKKIQPNDKTDMGHSTLTEDKLRIITEALKHIIASKSTGCDLDVTPDDVSEERLGVVGLIDFRGCYPHLYDPCPNLDVLAEQIGGRDPKLEKVKGTSWRSPRGTDVLMAESHEHDFVLKRIASDHVRPMRSALLKLMSQMTADPEVRRTASLITPVCSVVTIDPHAKSRTHGLFESARHWVARKVFKPENWVLMRRARLSAQDFRDLGLVKESSKNEEVDYPAFQMYDLKGQVPFGRLQFWVDKHIGVDKSSLHKVRDRGYKENFPLGLEIKGTKNCQDACGQFESLLKEDSFLLDTMTITGYSILVEVYASNEDAELEGYCGGQGHWPAVFKARDPKTKKWHIVSIGLIDYSEEDKTWRDSNRLVVGIKLKPSDYREKFQTMFKPNVKQSYFHCYDSDFKYAKGKR